jgi:2-dehydropantoate 2-reductase
MNIVVLGAGAIGSFYGAMLCNKNNVVLVGRKSHVNAIKEKGLDILDKTNVNVKINSEFSIKNVNINPDLLILTVKSYDTDSAIREAKKIVTDKTVILSLQNGLDNIDRIKKIINGERLIAGVTTHGVLFNEPGVVRHTGEGITVLGEMNGQKSRRIKSIVDVFNEAGIKTIISEDIIREIWIKAIVNSSINPLTTFFCCKNGYLLENPILEKIVEKICRESTEVAMANCIDLSFDDMIKNTNKIITETAENDSSMLQSFRKGRKTEVDSINGKLVDIGNKYGINTSMNEMMIYIVKSLYNK